MKIDLERTRTHEEESPYTISAWNEWFVLEGRLVGYRIIDGIPEGREVGPAGEIEIEVKTAVLIRDFKDMRQLKILPGRTVRSYIRPVCGRLKKSGSPMERAIDEYIGRMKEESG